MVMDGGTRRATTASALPIVQASARQAKVRQGSLAQGVSGMATGANILLGWKAGPEQYPPMELLDYAVAAEQAGFDCLDTSDHFNPWDPAGQACFTWTWLGAVAVKTSKMMIGTGVTCSILRYHPAIVAQAAATLGVMAPNRTYVCVGTGEALNEYAATGAWPGYDERQAMLAE